ncbi:MAG: LysM peptidoglycan-binding domain-containing protein [Myxococcales bacterium]|nr:LysM peptidoglycan-binding domain-containing protein [Myxococcales bacterium]
MAENGALQKAKIAVYEDDAGKSKLGAGFSVDFMFNPEAVRVTKTLKPKEQKAAGQNAPSPQFTGGNAAQLEFGEILFDTYETRQNVYTSKVTRLEALIKLDEQLHRPPMVMFLWGQGWGDRDGQINAGLWFVTGLDVNYTMFLPNGAPVRCTCKLTLTEVPETAVKLSPDTAHVHLVNRGDSLSGIAYREYDDAAQWRRIAAANGIDDPLQVEPGRRLLIPPILK